MSAPPRYARAPHGAHFGYNAGVRDVETWSVPQPLDAPRPADVPANAERHSGSLIGGVQYVHYVRWAPATDAPDCPTCRARRAS